MIFFKYHGTGNDFICFDNRKKNIHYSPNDIQYLCNRNFGIGADGVILMEYSEHGGDIFMNYYNADGSISEMCGNGVRVSACFAQEVFGIETSEILVETRDGIKTVKTDKNGLYSVHMGVPRFTSSDFPNSSQMIKGHEWHFVSMGNPHAVGFFETEELMNFFFDLYAADIETMTDIFPNKINVNFVVPKTEDQFIVKTFERGVGPTLACGTGASACFAFIVQKFSLQNNKCQINIPGGTLFFELSPLGEIIMTGPAMRVFTGEISI